MMAEGRSAERHLRAGRGHARLVQTQGIGSLPYPRFEPGDQVAWDIDETVDLSELVPFIAKPFAPGNAFPADEVALEKLAFDKAFIGSCTNGGYDDLLEARVVLRAGRERGFEKAPKTFVIFPGSGGVKRDIENPEPRLGGESIASVLRSVGGEIRESWCGPCFGQGPDALKKGEVAITSFNRNCRTAWALVAGVALHPQPGRRTTNNWVSRDVEALRVPFDPERVASRHNRVAPTTRRPGAREKPRPPTPMRFCQLRLTR